MVLAFNNKKLFLTLFIQQIVGNTEYKIYHLQVIYIILRYCGVAKCRSEDVASNGTCAIAVVCMVDRGDDCML